MTPLSYYEAFWYGYANERGEQPSEPAGRGPEAQAPSQPTPGSRLTLSRRSLESATAEAHSERPARRHPRSGALASTTAPSPSLVLGYRRAYRGCRGAAYEKPSRLALASGCGACISALDSRRVDVALDVARRSPGTSLALAQRTSEPIPPPLTTRHQE